MEVKGVQIIKIGELKQITDTYKNVSFVVKTIGEQYPQEIEFQVSQDKADKFIQYNKVGDIVDIDYNLRGRSWLKDGEPETSRRWFNTLDAWKIFKAESNTPPPVNEPFATTDDFNDDQDPLPF